MNRLHFHHAWGILAMAITTSSLPSGHAEGAPLKSDHITWTETAGLQVDGWLAVEEDYGASATNRVLRQTADTIEYENHLVRIRKRWRLEESTLVVEQDIEPLSEAGRTSQVILRVKPLRPFQRYYAPYGFSSPDVSGRWIEAGELPRIECGYRGAYSNSMFYWLLHGERGALMFDRILANGFLVGQGGIREAAGDLSELVWPMLAYGHWSWQPGHPGPEKGQAWMDNLYPDEGGSVAYRIHFFDALSRDNLNKRADQLYTGVRKQFRAETLYRGWERYHRPPEKPIGLFAFVGNWGKEPYGGSGYLKQNAAHYLANLKRMRAILDDHGMADAQIYFWVMLYDQAEDNPQPEAGWGRFPLDAQDLKDFYADLRREIHDLHLGVYVNFWLCSVKARVYRDHPEWFTSEFHHVDSGGDAYAGKLPGWADYLAGEIPAVLDAYDLDFIFFDGADWATRWRGSNQQCREFYMKISETMHAHNAEFVANSDIPFVDIGMYEWDTGQSEESDRALAADFGGRTFHKHMFCPMFAWRTWEPERLEASGRSLVENFADKPGFITRWPVHFYDALNEHVMNDFLVPFVKKRAEALGRQAEDE